MYNAVPPVLFFTFVLGSTKTLQVGIADGDAQLGLHPHLASVRGLAWLALGLRQVPARRRTPLALPQITAFWMQLVSMLSAAGAVVALWFIVPPAA